MTIACDHDLFRRLFAAVNAHGRGESGWTRAPWTDELRAAEAEVMAVAEAAGLACAHDPAGNLWITDPAAPAEGLVAAGSHLDTVPAGGAFDGAQGVVSALVAVLALRAAGVPGAERLAVISFADEEGSRFNTPCFGSRTMTGTFGDEVADSRDQDGISIREAGPERPADAAGLHRRLAAYYEIHVEQGLVLDPADVTLGIATRLSARGRWEWSVAGEANHAGTTPMAGRRDALVRAAQRMGAVIDDLLGLSRASRKPLTVAPVDITAMAGEIAGELKESSGGRDVEVFVQPGLAATADASLLRIVLVNLLGNAWKFTSTHPAARIEVGRKEVGGEDAFFVRDGGVGFDQDQASHLFTAFQQFHPPGEFEGSGIGLATVRRIIARHGGRVWAEGEPGKGATFWFQLPSAAGG